MQPHLDLRSEASQTGSARPSWQRVGNIAADYPRRLSRDRRRYGVLQEQQIAGFQRHETRIVKGALEVERQLRELLRSQT